jgi:Cu-Zn family superoxide dismutase
MTKQCALLSALVLAAATVLPAVAQEQDATEGQAEDQQTDQQQTDQNQDGQQPTRATATLSGEGIDGTVVLTETASGTLLVAVEVAGVPEGWHGIHFHETGECEGDFESAGGHIARGLEHGIGTADGPHPGDLPNVHADADGNIHAEFFTLAVTLAVSGELGLMDEDGTALILHENPDDYQSQPGGESGARIACGVLQAG